MLDVLQLHAEKQMLLLLYKQKRSSHAGCASLVKIITPSNPALMPAKIVELAL